MAAVNCLSEGVSSCPCLCVDSMVSSRLSIKRSTIVGNGRRRQVKQKRMMVHLNNSFLNSWHQSRLSAATRSNGNSRKRQGLIVVDELGGQYEDTFNDIKMELVNYFTFKAVRTVLEQLYEMNPPQYIWFNNFVAENVPNKGKRFLQTLVKERRELAERVMITRLTLYGRWIKKCDLGEIYNEISDENLKLMRERLLETIQWPSDDTTKPDQKTD
ncbi:Chaperonin-like RbcX protein [Perilla frutescens var. hirtella]|uniref:Chaperonin-like RbcX protein n=1 Tax=Perilla frutescens var. hirtella TaxID=608512 RepID=A0AAD4JND1_PERFH|nr:Chaperonin-like RbcX protein [Perilla frutescens var. hirtella]